MRKDHVSSIARLHSALCIRHEESKSKENIPPLNVDRPVPDTVRMVAALRLRKQPCPLFKSAKEVEIPNKLSHINRMALALAYRKLPTESPLASSPHVIHCQSDFAIARLIESLRQRNLPSTEEEIGTRKVTLNFFISSNDSSMVQHAPHD